MRSSVDSKDILIAPTGKQKELLDVDDIIVMNEEGNELENCNALKPSACLSIFRVIYASTLSPCSAIIHSHSSTFVDITNVFPGSEFKVSHYEMIKGITGHQNSDVLVIPIIENTLHEEELAASVGAAARVYPRSPAVLVRNHGIYVWGPSWEKAKIHAECIDYLCRISSSYLTPTVPPLAVIDSRGVCIPCTMQAPRVQKPRVWKVPEMMEQPYAVGYSEDGVRVMEGTEPKEFVDFAVLEEVGVTYDLLSGEEVDEGLEEVKVRDGYQNWDVVTLDGNKMEKEKYEGITTKFFETHYHEDDEVRYILDGGGYFDCRVDGEWLRIQVKKGDCIVIPEFLWHRFATDTNHMVKAMRLFKEAPKWEALTDPEQPERLEKVELKDLNVKDEKKVERVVSSGELRKLVRASSSQEGERGE